MLDYGVQVRTLATSIWNTAPAEAFATVPLTDTERRFG
jgi:hypothetical protein